MDFVWPLAKMITESAAKQLEDEAAEADEEHPSKEIVRREIMIQESSFTVSIGRCSPFAIGLRIGDRITVGHGNQKEQCIENE